jgi:phosphatase NudJ
MSIFNHDIYDNIRTRAIVLHRSCILVIPAGSVPEASDVWRLPGGGLKPHESLAECARREVLEETGISVRVGRIAFLREWIVPRFTLASEPDPDGRGHGYGLEVFHFASPVEPVSDPRSEEEAAPLPRWVPLTEVYALPLWPKEIKVLCQRLLQGQSPEGCVSIVGHMESPLATMEHDPFA